MKNLHLAKFVTMGSLVAMVLGIGAGVWAKTGNWLFAKEAAPYIEVVVQVWVVLLLLLILPMATSYIFNVFISVSGSKELGKLGGVALLVHLANLLIGVSIGLGLGYVAIHILEDSIPVFDQPALATEAINGLEAKGSQAVGEFIQVLKSVQILLGRIILYVIVCSIFLSVIISQVRWKIKDVILNYSKKSTERTFDLLQQFFFSLPAAVFCLLFVFSMKEGLFTAGAAGYLIVILSCLLLVLFFMQYIWVAIWGGVSATQFSKAIIPAQIMAVSTRSSLSAMPALLECAEKRLRLPNTISGVILPFFVTAFRVNYSISTTFALIFLAHIFQVELNILTIVLFVMGQLLLSFGSPGIPSGGNYINVSLYLAAGIPIEGVLLMKAVDHIPDIFKTLLNVTEIAAISAVVLKYYQRRKKKEITPEQRLG